MVTKQQFLSKGFYQYAQVGNPVLVKDYIFARQEGKKCLMVRFSNELEYTVDAMAFTVIQMDAAGKVLANTDIQYVEMNFCPGGTYVSDAGIVVDEYCTDFRIVLSAVRSGQYEYVPHGSHTAVRYLRKQQPLETLNVTGSQISQVSVRKRRFGKPGLSVLLATIAVVVLLAGNALSIGWNYYETKREEAEAAERAKEEASEAAKEQESMVYEIETEAYSEQQ